MFHATQSCQLNKAALVQAWIKPGARERIDHSLPGTFEQMAGTFWWRLIRERLRTHGEPARYSPEVCTSSRNKSNCCLTVEWSNDASLPSTLRRHNHLRVKLRVYLSKKTFPCVWNLTSFFTENQFSARQSIWCIHVVIITKLNNLSNHGIVTHET